MIWVFDTVFKSTALKKKKKKQMFKKNNFDVFGWFGTIFSRSFRAKKILWSVYGLQKYSV